MTDQFKIGDKVELISGGPPMTVENIANDGIVHRVWFEGTTAKRLGFKPGALKKSTPPKSVTEVLDNLPK